jgi:CHAT domain-containing protein
MASALVLNDGASLSLRDLLTSSLKARLVVMSACDTALTGSELPDEVIGLPVGMLQAGATGVVATQWPVADGACLLLMLSFYDLLRNGVSAPDALRQAQTWLRDSTSGQIRSYLTDQEWRVRSGAPWPPKEVLDKCFEVVAFDEAETRAFTNPCAWAGFVYVGA